MSSCTTTSETTQTNMNTGNVKKESKSTKKFQKKESCKQMFDFKQADRIVSRIYNREMDEDDDEPIYVKDRHAWRSATFYAYLQTRGDSNISYLEWRSMYENHS